MPRVPGNLVDLLGARSTVRNNFGPATLDRLPPEAMQTLMQDFGDRSSPADQAALAQLGPIQTLTTVPPGGQAQGQPSAGGAEGVDLHLIKLPQNLNNDKDFEMMEWIQDVVPSSPADDVYTVARHLKKGSRTRAGINAQKLPPQFTTDSSLEDLRDIKRRFGL